MLACPRCRSGSLDEVECVKTRSGRIKHGSLLCPNCDQRVATIRHGKIDFVRCSPVGFPLSGSIAESRCEEFAYRRIPWNDISVRASNCRADDLGWNAEGFRGCWLGGNNGPWSIEIDSDATDLSLRFHCHDWSGSVSVSVDGRRVAHADLYQREGSGVRVVDVFRDLPGSKRITIEPGERNPQSGGAQVFFFGIDACFPGSPVESRNNRGNGYPTTYDWVVERLDEAALVLDCGCGDRRFGDRRVVGFEYLSFEYPDVFGDGHALPFRDCVFDAVFSQAVMEHMRDPYLAAREIGRVLKPGGVVYVESAFMQPLHAVPYHFFNTTTWGLEALFEDAEIEPVVSEWLGALSASVEWYLSACGGGGLSRAEHARLKQILKTVDRNTSYEQLKPVASAVALWGVKEGGGEWEGRLRHGSRPTFRYPTRDPQRGLWDRILRAFRGLRIGGNSP